MRRKEDLEVKEKCRKRKEEEAVDRKVFGECESKFKALLFFFPSAMVFAFEGSLPFDIYSLFFVQFSLPVLLYF